MKLVRNMKTEVVHRADCSNQGQHTCGWARGHDGPHSWSTLPTFPTFPAVTP